MNKMKHCRQGLLDQLSSETDCMYLSDLHRPELLPVIRQAVGGIAPNRYSLREWNDAAQYITGKHFSFEDECQAALFLQSYGKESDYER